MSDPTADRNRFYQIMESLSSRTGTQTLHDCNSRMNWPQRGVYFFFEPGEVRQDGQSPRVVRVGTHAVSKGSKTTLWNRLSQHKGNAGNGGGNHRGSIFRKHFGGALLNRGEVSLSPNSWGEGSNAPRLVKDNELPVEQAVSAYLCAMPFLWINADDEPDKNSVRSYIERNSIALLSCLGSGGNTADPPTTSWLGLHCPHVKVQNSGLWNVRHVEEKYDPAFLEALEQCAIVTEAIAGGQP